MKDEGSESAIGSHLQERTKSHLCRHRCILSIGVRPETTLARAPQNAEDRRSRRSPSTTTCKRRRTANRFTPSVTCYRIPRHPITPESESRGSGNCLVVAANRSGTNCGLQTTFRGSIHTSRALMKEPIGTSIAKVDH